MTTYEEAIRMHAGRRPILSRTIVLEADSDDDDDVCDDLEPLDTTVQNKLQLSLQSQLNGHKVANPTRQPASTIENVIPEAVDKTSDDTCTYGNNVTTNLDFDEEECRGGVPIIPNVSQEKPEYVIVRTHDKRDGTVREYAVLKGTPVSEVLRQYARETGIDDEELSACVKAIPDHKGADVEPPLLEPIIGSSDDCGASCSWHSVICGLNGLEIAD